MTVAAACSRQSGPVYVQGEFEATHACPNCFARDRHSRASFAAAPKARSTTTRIAPRRDSSPISSKPLAARRCARVNFLEVGATRAAGSVCASLIASVGLGFELDSPLDACPTSRGESTLDSDSKRRRLRCFNASRRRSYFCAFFSSRVRQCCLRLQFSLGSLRRRARSKPTARTRQSIYQRGLRMNPLMTAAGAPFARSP